jgi:hypothetical protein
MRCDFEHCKNEAASVCMIVDLAGEVYHRDFCVYHLKKMLHDEKNVNYESSY